MAHYYLLVNAMTQPMMVREDQLTYLSIDADDLTKVKIRIYLT